MKVDIVTPEKILFSENNISMVTVPAIEGQIGFLDNHVPLITFLKPGIVNVENKKNKYFFTTGGVVDFKDNFLSILCQIIYDIEDLTDEEINKLNNNANNIIRNKNSSDQDVFISYNIINELNLLKSK